MGNVLIDSLAALDTAMSAVQEKLVARFVRRGPIAFLSLAEDNFFHYMYPFLNEHKDYQQFVQLRKIYSLAALSLVWTGLQMIQSMVSTVTNISAYIVCMGAAALVITLLRDPRLTRIVGMLYMLFLSSIVLMIGFVEPPAISLSRLGAIFAVGSCTGTEGTFTSGLIVLAFLRYQLPRMDLTQQLGGIYVENEFEFFREYGFALWWHWVWVFYITNLHMSASTRAQEELEQKNLWLAKLSHEMQTPVVGILGLWELVETQASEQSKIMMGEVAPMMRDCIQSLQRLIKDILDMSKLHQGLIKFNFSDFDAAELFRSSVSMAQRSCGQKPVQIRLENHTSESLMIHSDPVRLNQVLTNVLSNAVKFTDNGTISVHLWIEKDSDDDSSKAMFCFSVEDTGVGIPEKFIEGEIFHTFSQTSEGRSRGGSGLGLAISRQIVQALHGTISCRRRVRSPGSIFEVRLPTTILKTTPDTYKKYECGKATGNVLLAEDTVVSSIVLSKLLTNQGYNVTAVPNGKVAVDLLKKESMDCAGGEVVPKFDILVLDLEMPEMDGWQVLEWLKEQKNDIPVLVLTAFQIDQETESVLSMGAREVVSKPVESEKLRQAIERCKRSKATVRCCPAPSPTEG